MRYIYITKPQSATKEKYMARKGTVRLRNKYTEDFSQEWKGKTISIPAGKAIEMEYMEAVAFRGSFGGNYPSGHPNVGEPKIKMIDIEEIGEVVVEQEYICNMCGEKFASQDALDAHMKLHKGETDEPVKTDMIKCPMCGKELKNNRDSLKMHLNRYCKG